VAIDTDKSAQKTIDSNAKTLKLGREFKLIQASAGGWLNTSSDKVLFDIVLCDPPYQDLQPNLISRLAERVKPTGLLVLSWPGKQPPPELEGFTIVRHKNYGDIQLVFFEHTA
jgi:16S rRNA G966 N2-methylase RsmD